MTAVRSQGEKRPGSHQKVISVYVGRGKCLVLKLLGSKTGQKRGGCRSYTGYEEQLQVCWNLVQQQEILPGKQEACSVSASVGELSAAAPHCRHSGLNIQQP